jgi:penicillin amidase
MDPAAGTAVTLHTPFYTNEIGAEQGWSLFAEATNIDEFEDAVEMIWPSHNFYWADTDGNIGYWHAGRFPLKPAGADRRLPLAGDGTQEWVRVTEPWEMPRSINPEQGWLINWNNKPIAGWPYAESDVHWGEGHRVQILMGAMATFAASGALTTDTLNQINQVGGYHDTAGMSFAGDLIGALTGYVSGTPDPVLYAALGYLGAWATAEPLPVSRVDFASPAWPNDPNPTYDHPGLTIFNAWYDRIVPKVFAGILPSDLIGQAKSYSSLLIRVFRDDASLLYPGYPSGAALNTMIVEALEEAIADLTTEYGSSDMSTWLTPVRMQSYDAMGALPGGPLHPYMNRGTYNQIAEMVADGLPNAKNVIPPGQSGLVVLPGTPSPHVADQVVLYASWTYKPMLHTLAAVEAVETSRNVFYAE